MAITDKNESGKWPLSDEELNAAAGGQTNPMLVQGWKKAAERDGRPTHVGMLRPGWEDGRCPHCYNLSAVFCEYRATNDNGKTYFFHNAKCYFCDYTFPKPLSMSIHTELYVVIYDDRVVF